MSNIFYIESPYLAHYGILGMKWGVRRFQNEDGTLTDAGRRRVRRAMNKRDRMLEYGVSTKEYRKRNKKFTKYTRKLSDKEIEELSNKIKVDNALRSLSENKERINKGRDATEKLIKAVDIAVGVSKAYSTFATGRKVLAEAKGKRLENKAFGKDNTGSVSDNFNNSNKTGNNSNNSSNSNSNNTQPVQTTIPTQKAGTLKAPKVDRKTKKLIESMQVGTPQYKEYLHKGSDTANKILGINREDMVNELLRDSYKSTGDKYKPR